MNWKRILSETVLAALHACTSALEAEIRREAGEPEPEPAGAPPPPEPPPASAKEPEPETAGFLAAAEPGGEPEPTPEPEPTTPETGLLAATETPSPEVELKLRVLHERMARLKHSLETGAKTWEAVEALFAQHASASPIATSVQDHLSLVQLPLLRCFARAVHEGHRGELRGRAREIIEWLEEKGIAKPGEFISNDLVQVAHRTPFVSRTVKAKDRTWIWSVQLDWFVSPPPDVLAALHACTPASQIHRPPPGAAH